MYGMAKRALLMAAMLVVLLCIATNALADTYKIGTLDELKDFRDAVNAGNDYEGQIVELTDDIDMENENWSPIGIDTDEAYFRGEFDGNGHTLYNMTSKTANGLPRAGLFGLVEYAYIHDVNFKNVTLVDNHGNSRMGVVAGNLQYWNVVENVNIDGVKIQIKGADGLVGTVAGYVWKSQLGNVNVKDVEMTATASGNVVGGMVGYGRGHVWDTGVIGNNAHWLDGSVQTIDGTKYVLQNYFTDCTVDNINIKMTGGGEAGGFFGSDTYNNHSNFFKDCAVTGLTMNLQNGTYSAGGFIAWKNGTTTAGTFVPFDGCSVSGVINGDQGNYGGFVGQVGGRAASFENAVADVDIVCNGNAGGFVGTTAQYFNHLESFTNCEANGDVQGATAGGFAGMLTLGGDGDNINVDLIDCVANGNVKGTTAGGLIGEVKLELPTTNWSTVTGTGEVEIKNCEANGSVTSSKNAGSLIGLVQNKTEIDSDADAVTSIIAENVVVSEEDMPPYNSTEEDTVEPVISITRAYKISYDLDGGKATNNPHKYIPNTKVTLKNPTREGYTFLGWTGAGIVEPQLNLTIELTKGDVEFVANWELIPVATPVPDTSDLPKTGDNSNIALFAALLTMSAAGMLLLMRRRSTER